MKNECTRAEIEKQFLSNVHTRQQMIYCYDFGLDLQFLGNHKKLHIQDEK
jgi:hypothetical protein